jgi:putative ABC transport system permease protein
MNATDFKLAAKLTAAHMWHRPGRIGLTVLATIAASCIVVWVVSSYDSLLVKFDEFAEHYLGRYEFVALPVAASDGPGVGGMFGPPPTRLTRKFIDELSQDPAVATVDPILQTRATFTNLNAEGADPDPVTERRIESGPAIAYATASPRNEDDSPPAIGPGVAGGPGRGQVFNANRNPTLVGTNAAEAPYTLVEGAWIRAAGSTAESAAVSSGVAEALKLKIGDELEVTSRDRQESVVLKIVGIVEQRKPLPTTPPIIGLPAMRGPPLTRGPASAAVYVALPLAERIAGISERYDLAGIILKRGVEFETFQQNWTERLSNADPAAYLQSLQDVDTELQDSTTSTTVRSQAYAATGISLLAALFIIFSTLSMGVDERVRQFAILRAVTLTKSQVGAMIGIESLFLGLIGWGGGLIAGWGLLNVVTQMRPDLFPVGARLGMWSILLSGACAVGGALIASIMPAWKATRVNPLEAMASQTALPIARISIVATVVGLVLISLNPILIFWLPMPDTSRYLASAAIGCTGMGIGFILLAPVTILLTERVVGPVCARLFVIHPSLLSMQLTANLWRTLGTTVALTLGLGLFIAMQTWGYSMLGPYTPGDWVPDMVVSFAPSGIPESEMRAVRQIPGVVADRSTPCISEQVKFATDVTGAKERATSSRQVNCVMVGIDPDLGLGGTRPIFDFHFAKGSRETALKKLQQGRFCLVPDHFERESKLTVGDHFAVIVPGTRDKTVEYEIAGVVSMTGWHWMSKVGLRNRGGGRSAGLMFTGINQVRDDFNSKRINSLWLNTDGTASEEEIKASLQKIVERNIDPNAIRGRGPRGGAGGLAQVGANTTGGGLAAGGGMGTGRRGGTGAGVNIRTREGVRTAIRERADGIIWLLSRLPLVTLLVTSLGVINTIVSSIRARRWDLGVMRAVGITRFSLFRMILCEAVLVGIAACVLSFGFGTLAGYCGTGVTRYVNVRGGQITPLIIPWTQIGIGFAMTLGLCLIAALWPAIRVGRAEPLRLLQSGRAST